MTPQQESWAAEQRRLHAVIQAQQEEIGALKVELAQRDRRDRAIVGLVDTALRLPPMTAIEDAAAFGKGSR